MYNTFLIFSLSSLELNFGYLHSYWRDGLQSKVKEGRKERREGGRESGREGRKDIYKIFRVQVCVTEWHKLTVNLP